MKRRLRPLFRVGILFLLLFLLSQVVHEFVVGEYFLVKTVYIQGNKDIFADISILQNPGHLLFVDTKKLELKIKKTTPWIDTLQIKKQWPNSLYINIHERTPLVLFTRGDQIFYIDESGVVLPPFARYQNQPLTQLECVVSETSGDTIGDQSIQEAVQIVSGLEENGAESPKVLACREDSTFVLHFTDTQVVFGKDESSTDVVNSLLFLFKQFRIEGTWPKSVDLRFEKPVLQVSL